MKKTVFALLAAVSMFISSSARAESDYMSIGMTPLQFQGLFNEAAEINRSGFRITRVNVEKQADGRLQFVYHFSTTNMILGTVNRKDGTIRSITMIGAAGDNVETAAQIPVLMHDLVTATNPTLAEEDGNRVAISLFMKAANNQGTPYQEVRNGLRYAVLSVNKNGLMFVIDPMR